MFKEEGCKYFCIFFNLQLQPTFHSEARLVNLVRGRERVLCWSIYIIRITKSNMLVIILSFYSYSFLLAADPVELCLDRLPLLPAVLYRT